MVSIEDLFFRENDNYAMGISNLHSILGNVVETGFNLMIICIKGYAGVEIYGKIYKLRIGNILNANWGMQLRFLSVSEDFKVFYFLMSEDFCNHVFRHLSPSLCYLSCKFPIWCPSSKQIKQLFNWIEQMMWIRENISGQQQGYLMRNGIETLFLICNYEAERLYPDKSELSIPRNWELSLKFGQLLINHIKQERKVYFYADKLCVTPYYLGTITRQTLNASPKAIIDRELIRQLKSFLSNTDKSLDLIAEEFNFDDTSYMCKFFKRHTKLTMLEYRKSVNK